MTPQKIFVSALILLGLSLSFAQDDHDHSDHAAMTGPKANVIELGSTMLELNPILLPDGHFYLGFIEAAHNMTAMADHDHSDTSDDSATDAASDGHASDDHADHDMNDDSDHSMHDAMAEDISLTITSPSGTEVSLEGHIMSALSADMGMIEEGSYQISGMLGEAVFETSVAVYRGKTDLDSDIYAIFAPSPSLSTMGMTEAFVYAFAEGESIHAMYLVNRKMAGMTHMTDEEEVELEHNHFEAFRSDGFEPAGNDIPLNFPMAGDWEFTISIMSSIPETASFTVSVLDN
ncbi:MAG: hypothetical protein KC422_18625 [Trueperaceae bacterium]|nr:hypothetical protein [Trueperaceae bacterium]